MSSLAGAAVDGAQDSLPFYTAFVQWFGGIVSEIGKGFSSVLWSAPWGGEFFRGNIFKNAVYGLQVFLTFFGAALLVAGRRAWWMVVGVALLLAGCGLFADAGNRAFLSWGPTYVVLGAVCALVPLGAVIFVPTRLRRLLSAVFIGVGGLTLFVTFRNPLDFVMGIALLVGLGLSALLVRRTEEGTRMRLGFWPTIGIGAAIWVGTIALMFVLSLGASSWWNVAGKYVPVVIPMIGLTLGGAGLFGAGLLVVGLKGTSAPRRLMIPLWIAMSLLAVGTYYNFGNPHVRYSNYYHRHEFFHYYVGSKYFDVLGYKHIYDCAAVAEKQDGKLGDPNSREIRDLKDNLIKPIAKTEVFHNPEKYCITPLGDRWDEFRSDIAWFRNSAHGGDYWKSMWKDHGYNPPPVWTMEGQLLSALTPADSDGFLALSMIDVSLQLLALLLIFWAFGWQVGAVAAVFWGCNAPADFYWTGGAFLRQDWYFLVVASVCFARKRMYGLSGGALVWAAMLRAFPAFLFIGWACIVLSDLVRAAAKGKWFGDGVWLGIGRDRWRLIGGSAIAVAVLFTASSAVTGPTAYLKFYDHISTHEGTPLTNHMGLPTILSHSWDGRMMVARNDTLDDPFEDWKAGRTDRKNAWKPVQYTIIGIMAAWIAWCVRRTKLLWIAVPLSIGIVPAMLNMTCYYFCMYIVVAVLTRVRPAIGAAALIASGGSQIMHHSYHFFDDRFTADSWIFIVLSFVALFAYSRPISFARVKRWFSGKGELPVATASGAR